MSTCTMVASSNTRRVVACLQLCHVFEEKTHTKTRPLKNKPSWISWTILDSSFVCGLEVCIIIVYMQKLNIGPISPMWVQRNWEFALRLIETQDLQRRELARWHGPSCTGADDTLESILTIDHTCSCLWAVMMVQTILPSRELTYPTLGKGKSSSKCNFWGIC